MRKRVSYWTMTMLCMIVLTIVYSLSIEIKAATMDVVSESAVAVKTTDFFLYKGQEAEFEDLPSENVRVDNPSIVSVSGKTVQALSKGTANIYVESGNDSTLYATITVKENENLIGVTFSDEDYPAVMAGTAAFRIEKDEFMGLSCKYTSLNSLIASVDDQGNVTPLSSGETSIHIEVTDGYGGLYEYDVPIHVIAPHFQSSKIYLAKGEQVFLKVADTAGVVPAIVSSDSAVFVEYSDATGVMVRAKKKGSAVLKATAEGVSYTCKVIVTDPRMKRQYGFYETNKSFTLSLSGKKSGSVLKWYSANKKIATVTSKGKVRTKKMGSTVIGCVADGRTLTFYLAVSTRIAVKAMRFGYTQVGKKHYSQARRMSKNYYDCSSFVYRSYRAAGKYLVRRTNWAPMAAEIGQYYVRKGRQVKCSGKTYNWNKLRPGDLVCFGGYSARRNGRYKRIYHIAMYIGNGKTLESSSLFNNVAIRDREPLTKSSVPVIVRPT